MADNKEQELMGRNAADKAAAQLNNQDQRDPLAELQRILSSEDPFKVFDTQKPSIAPLEPTKTSSPVFETPKFQETTASLNVDFNASNSAIQKKAPVFSNEIELEPIKIAKSHATPTLAMGVETTGVLGASLNSAGPSHDLDSLEAQLKSLAKDIEQNFKVEEPIEQGELFSSLQAPSESIGLRRGIDSELEFEKNNFTSAKISAPDVADTIRFFDGNSAGEKITPSSFEPKPQMSTPIFAPLRLGSDDGIDKNRQRAFSPILSDDDVPNAADLSKNSSLKVLAAVVAVAVLGAGGLMVLNKFGNKTSGGEPQIIRADDSAVKVRTENAADASKLAPNGAQVDQQLVTREEKPKSLDKLPSQQGNEPLKQSPNSSISNPKEGGIQANSAAQIFGAPKKVKALMVGPDGKLITQEEAANTPNTPSSVAAEIAKSFDSAAQTQLSTPTIINGMRVPSARPLPVTSVKAETAPIAITEKPIIAPPIAEKIVEKKPEKKPEKVSEKPKEKNMEALVQQVTSPVSSAANAPIALENAPNKTTKAASYIAQLSAQRSEAAARVAYADLQKKHPAILGGKKATIIPIDLGERGTFYRVRLGGYTVRDDAQNLCSKLKASGADCIVQPN